MDNFRVPPAAPVGNVDSGASSGTSKRRGRPPGSGSKQKDAPGVLGVGVHNTGGVPAAIPEGNVDSRGGTPSSGTSKGVARPPKDALGAGVTIHSITVDMGKDIASTIAGLQGPRRVSILSANGLVSHVTLRQPGGGSSFHEGPHDIITLGYSLPKNDDNGQIVLTLEMAGPDNAVYGGVVVGELRAASDIEIMVACFLNEKGKKPEGGSSPAPGPMGGLLPIL